MRISCSSAAIRCRPNRACTRCSSTGSGSCRGNEMIAALVLSILLVQDPPKPAPPAAPTPAAPEKKAVYTALIGGDVYTVTKGVMKGGTVLLKDDKIFRVGAGVDLPEGTTKI